MRTQMIGKFGAYTINAYSPWNVNFSISQDNPLFVNGVPIYGDIYVKNKVDGYNLYRVDKFLQSPSLSALNKIKQDVMGLYGEFMTEEVKSQLLKESYEREINSVRDEIDELEQKLQAEKDKLAQLQQIKVHPNMWTKTRLMCEPNTPLGRVEISGDEVRVYNERVEYYPMMEFLRKLNGVCCGTL